jgi:hypothetical protein
LNFTKYFESIDDLPLFNWIRCNGGDLRFVRKNIEDGDDKTDRVVWEKIFDSYLKEFGLNRKYQMMLKAIQKRALLELDFVITRDRFKLTQIEMEVQRLNSMVTNNNQGMTIDRTLIHLSKWIGQWMNSKNITTREYFNLLNEFEKTAHKTQAK